MSAIEESKKRIAGRIWQSIGQSGVDVSSVPKQQMDNLVSQIADGVMIEFDAILDEMEPSTAAAQRGPAQPAQPEQQSQPLPPALQAAAQPAGTWVEETLWEGRPFMSLVERYIITNQRVRVITGLVGRNNEDIEMVRVKDVDHTQGLSERILGIGDVALRSGDASRPDVVLRNVKDPAAVHEDRPARDAGIAQAVSIYLRTGDVDGRAIAACP